jgi:hypothetical protein
LDDLNKSLAKQGIDKVVGVRLLNWRMNKALSNRRRKGKFTRFGIFCAY